MLTHGTKRAEIDFMVFLTIFEYAESNAEWCQAQLFMQRLEFYDLKLSSKIARKSVKNKGFSTYKKKNEMNRALGHLCAHIG